MKKMFLSFVLLLTISMPCTIFTAFSNDSKYTNSKIQQTQSQKKNVSIPGRFPQASERLLTASDLQGLSKNDLKIMRNEIFARHGYIFQTQDMKSYFQNQSWYSPQSSNVTAKLSNIEVKNVALIQRYENNAAGSVSTKGAPPIVNTNGLWNAVIRVPKNWTGKSIYANGFVFIWNDDKKLQDKYNVHPGQRSPKDGHIYFDENDCFNDSCWREIWDDDERFYEYALSPNVVLEADVYSTKRKMTVSQFADYYKQQGYYTQINEKTGEENGMLANVTYENGMITKIVEGYIP